MTIHVEGLLVSSICLAAALLQLLLPYFFLKNCVAVVILNFIFILTTGDKCDMVDIMTHQIPLVCSLASHLVLVPASTQSIHLCFLSSMAIRKQVGEAKM